MKSIFIADHHPMTRKGISCMLKENKNFSIIGKANNGAELYRNPGYSDHGNRFARYKWHQCPTKH